MQVGIIPVTAFQQNCSVIQCEETRKGAVVDPGGDLEQVLAYLKEEAVDVDKILLTHGHIDHAGATRQLADRLSVPIIGPHRDDEFLLQSLAAQGQMFGLGQAAPFVPDQWLEQGDVVMVGHERFEVRHCPGHTPGHVVFYNAARHFVIVGDVLFDGSIGRTDFPRGDYGQLIHSIRTQLLTLSDDTTFLPGHGPTSTIGTQRQHNPFLRS